MSSLLTYCGPGDSRSPTQEAGKVGQSDAEQLAYAVRRKRMLVTHNRDDFERLAS